MKPNHTCGGANVWADVRSSSEIFCSAGSYCPTTTKRISCSSGYYFAPKLDYFFYKLPNLGPRSKSVAISLETFSSYLIDDVLNEKDMHLYLGSKESSSFDNWKYYLRGFITIPKVK